jgi:hypothetical protein
MRSVAPTAMIASSIPATLFAGRLSIATMSLRLRIGTADPPVSYLVGTPKGRLSKLEKYLVTLPWQAVRLKCQLDRGGRLDRRG